MPLLHIDFACQESQILFYFQYVTQQASVLAVISTDEHAWFPRRCVRQNRLLTLKAIRRGSSVKTLVVSMESSELVKASTIGASSNTFFT